MGAKVAMQGANPCPCASRYNAKFSRHHSAVIGGFSHAGIAQLVERPPCKRWAGEFKSPCRLQKIYTVNTVNIEESKIKNYHEVMQIRKELIEAVKQGNVRKFYKSREWRKKRRQIMKRDNYECQKCKSEGKYHKAKTVHHIKHLREFPELALVDSNLISLCYNCHNEEHPEKLCKVEVNRREDIIPERW